MDLLTLTGAAAPEKKTHQVFCFREGVHSILEAGADGENDVWMHLLTGEERSLLVDTGYGQGNILEIVERFTDTPIDVFNTHHHVDHCSANKAFAHVYAHTASIPYLEGAMGTTAQQLTGVEAGFRFRLGCDHFAEVFYVPGHAAGSCMILDRKRRVLVSGDSAMSGRISVMAPRPGAPYGDRLRLICMLEGLDTISDDAYDMILPGHNAAPIMGTLAPLRRAIREIVNDPESYDLDGSNFMKKPVRLKYVSGFGLLEFKENGI